LSIRLLRLTGPFRWRLALAALLGAGTVGASIGLLATSGWLISRAAQQPPILDLSVAIVGVRFFALARAGLRYSERLVSHELALRLLADLRVWLYRGLEPLLPAGLSEVPTAELLQRLVSDVEALQDFFIRVVTPPAVAAASLLLALAVLAPAGVDAMAALALPFLVAALVLPLLTRRLASAPSRRQAALRGRLLGSVVELVDGGPELAVLGRERDAVRRLAGVDRALLGAGRSLAALAAAGDAAVLALSGVAGAGVLAAALAASGQHRIGGPMLAAVTLAALAVFEAAGPLPAAVWRLEAATASARRLFEIADTPSPVAGPSDPKPLPSRLGELRLEGAWLRYAPDRPWAVRGLDLRLAEGRRVALVGPSGVGKSTAANLLAGFRHPDLGRVTLAGHDLSDFAPDDLRRVVCLCAQDAHVFNTTIRENIRLARTGAADADVALAAQRAGLESWIASLPAGWDTVVGEDGGLVSGGQRQRIAVARGLLSGARFLLLDEPTAHLDSETAERLMTDVLAATEGLGLLLITHRREGLAGMDEVVALAA
jgi:thiol reductant ABC exporter CydC subunit